MNRVLLSLVLTLSFSVLIVLGVGFFHIMSEILNSNIAVLAVGFVLLYFICFISINNLNEGLNGLSILDEDDEEIV